MRRERPAGGPPPAGLLRFGRGCGPTSGVARAASRRVPERRAAVCGPWLRRRRALRGVAGRLAGGRAPRGRPTALPRWRSAAWRPARISRRRTRRVISLACLFAFGAQGDPRGDVLRGRPRRTSPYRMRRGARTRSLLRALSALSRWVRCIGPITLRVLKRPCRTYT